MKYIVRLILLAIYSLTLITKIYAFPLSCGKDNVVCNNDSIQLDGVWGLTNYFDTILENREFAKYQLQTPTWFAILLEISDDTINSFGSIEYYQFPIQRKNDTLAILSSNIAKEDWILLKHGQELKLIQSSNEGNKDSTIYIFKKRDNLNYFTKENLGFYIIDENITDYFNEHLFKGIYINKDTKQEVIFGENGQLKGIADFDSYKIDNYFGTLHMFKNLDVMVLKNTTNGKLKFYNWVFFNDELILTEFVPEDMFDENGVSYRGDFYILGEEKIILENKQKQQ